VVKPEFYFLFPARCFLPNLFRQVLVVPPDLAASSFSKESIWIFGLLFRKVLDERIRLASTLFCWSSAKFNSFRFLSNTNFNDEKGKFEIVIQAGAIWPFVGNKQGKAQGRLFSGVTTDPLQQRGH
jgi:hypothetical protein